MGKYKYLTDGEQEILDSFPTLTQEELDKANDLFRHYIIYQTENGGRRFWTSCCHRDGAFEFIPARCETAELREALYGKHNDEVICPWCGRRATIKCKGKFQGARATYARGQVVFLKASENKIYAQSYWLRKDYRDMPSAYPHYSADMQYCFTQGKVMTFWKDWYGDEWHMEAEYQISGGKKLTKEPFWNGGLAGHSQYAVVGLGELEKSFLRYCDYRAWRNIDAPGAVLHEDLIRFLTVGSIYPRQLEMLVKTRQRTLISDMLWWAKKNARIFKWEETDPRRAFSLSKNELKEYLAKGDALAILKTRKLLKGSLAEAASWYEDILTGFDRLNEFESFRKFCAEHHVDIYEARKYLCRFTGPRCYGGIFGLEQAFGLWRDYLANAQTAGMDIAQRNILMPRSLEEAHDNAMQIAMAMKEKADRKKAKELERFAKQRQKTLDEKYGFETERYIIRAPRSMKEIMDEGKKLQHCVGGYARRHFEGSATILFLRDKAHPNTPLCTIEVSGNSLVQIHGYKNEWEKGAVSPKIRFEEIFKPWKAWLDKGCPKKKDGTPQVPKTKKKGNKAA